MRPFKCKNETFWCSQNLFQHPVFFGSTHKSSGFESLRFGRCVELKAFTCSSFCLFIGKKILSSRLINSIQIKSVSTPPDLLFSLNLCIEVHSTSQLVMWLFHLIWGIQSLFVVGMLSVRRWRVRVDCDVGVGTRICIQGLNSRLFKLLLQSQLHLHYAHANPRSLASEGVQSHLISFKASIGFDEHLWKLWNGSPWRTDGFPHNCGFPSIKVRVHVCVCQRHNFQFPP